MNRPTLPALLFSLCLLAPAAYAQQPSPPTQPAQPGTPQQPVAPPGFGLPPFQMPPMPWQTPPPATPGSSPPTQAQIPQVAGVLLPALFGAQAWQSEVRSVLNELIASLPPDKQQLVAGMPLIFDPNPNVINAFAGCDERGQPFIAGTEGLLEAIDAIAQTTANDDLFATHTYDQYSATVMPKLVQASTASPALPLGTIPFNTVLDAHRISLARELFDNIAAFTFGHELAHHYLGHTGCARAAGGPPGFLDPSQFYKYGAKVPIFNQTLETAADTFGVANVLDAGRARRPNYPWNERGALLMLDFFSRLERAAGVSPLNPIGFLQSHPHPALRIPIVQFVAQSWHQSHPG